MVFNIIRNEIVRRDVDITLTSLLTGVSLVGMFLAPEVALAVDIVNTSISTYHTVQEAQSVSEDRTAMNITGLSLALIGDVTGGVSIYSGFKGLGELSKLNRLQRTHKSLEKEGKRLNTEADEAQRDINEIKTRLGDEEYDQDSYYDYYMGLMKKREDDRNSYRDAYNFTQLSLKKNEEEQSQRVSNFSFFANVEYFSNLTTSAFNVFESFQLNLNTNK